MANMKTITLMVTGEQKIHCAGCENTIQRALNRMPGVRSVQASHRTQRIELNLDGEQTALEQIKGKFDLMGYAVKEE